jgi:hypothetical protein
LRYYAALNRLKEIPVKTNKNNRGVQFCLLALLVLPVSGALGDWSVPEELRAKVNELDEAQRDFITSLSTTSWPLPNKWAIRPSAIWAQHRSTSRQNDFIGPW